MESGKNTKRCVSMKLVLLGKKKYNDESDGNVKNNRILITVNVVGSSGPLRFLVNKGDKVFNVIDLSLKLYARGGRLPVLGSDIKSFMRYASDAEPSGGPLRFVVNVDDKVSDVIDSSLKMYARGGRLPVLGSNNNNFLLYASNAESEAMEANEVVGSCGERSFVLCKKQIRPNMTEARSEMITRHCGYRGWKAWFKILSHQSF